MIDGIEIILISGLALIHVLTFVPIIVSKHIRHRSFLENLVTKVFTHHIDERSLDIYSIWVLKFSIATDRLDLASSGLFAIKVISLYQPTHTLPLSS